MAYLAEAQNQRTTFDINSLIVFNKMIRLDGPTNAIRTIILENNNNLIPFHTLFSQVKNRFPTLFPSKTRFHRVVSHLYEKNCLVRHQIQVQDAKGRDREVFGLRLRVTRPNRKISSALGYLLNAQGSNPVAEKLDEEKVAPAKVELK